jgi:cytidylate kinase
MTASPAAEKALLIAIDGPAGAGKTTISKALAGRLGYRYLDTGALYRGVAKAVEQAGIRADDDDALGQLCHRTRLNFTESRSGLRLMLNGRDISDAIRTPAISMLASAVSARPVVRAFLLETQRTIGREKGVVVEGRDMGTVVFPEADVKFFLHADSRERALRRFRELQAAGDETVRLEAVEADMVRRDRNDSTRAIAPLQPAVDAVRIDSTRQTIDQVIETMLDHIRLKLTDPEIKFNR